MNNIKLLTGGLVIIVLALAGGTGYLIYEKIQSEVGPTEKATKQELDDVRAKQEEFKKEADTKFTHLAETDTVLTAKVEVLEGDVAVLHAKDEQKTKLIDKLIKDGQATAEEISAVKAEQNDVRTKLGEMQTELDNAKKERQAIRDQLKAQGERIDAQDKRLKEIESKGDERDQEVAALRAELAELKRQLGLGDPKPEG